METRRGEVKRERDGWRRKRISYFVMRTCLKERLQWWWKLTKMSIDFERLIGLDVVVWLERPLRYWLWDFSLKMFFPTWTQTLNSQFHGYILRCFEPQSFWKSTKMSGSSSMKRSLLGVIKCKLPWRLEETPQNQYDKVFVKNAFSGTNYPVKNIRPALHSDALEHGEHGKQKIVEVGDAIVGTLPALSAERTVEQAVAAMPGHGTRCGLLFRKVT